MRAAVQSAMEKRLDEAKTRPAQTVNVDEVAEIVKSIVNSLEGDITAGEAKVYSELDALAKIIRNAKAEIAELRADEIRQRHLPVAQDELDAVVSATEAATNAIMAAAENIEATAGAIGGEHGDGLTDAVTAIYEACTFQDITGQRIKKVVRTLRQIEEKVAGLLTALGAHGDDAAGDAAAAEPGKPGAGPTDAELLNGPQLPVNAMNQDDIDAILNGSD